MLCSIIEHRRAAASVARYNTNVNATEDCTSSKGAGWPLAWVAQHQGCLSGAGLNILTDRRCKMSDQLQTLLGSLSGEQLTQLIKDMGIKVPETSSQRSPRKPQSEHGPCKRPATINLTVNCFCGNRWTTVKTTEDLSPLYTTKQDGSLRVTPLKRDQTVAVETWTKVCSSCAARVRLMPRAELEARYLSLAQACFFGGKPWIG